MGIGSEKANALRGSGDMLNLGGPGWFKDIFHVDVRFNTERTTAEDSPLGENLPVSTPPRLTPTPAVWYASSRSHGDGLDSCSMAAPASVALSL